MKKITYITGGERSGKSRFGQELALKSANNPVYLATARIKDDDFARRVNKHQAERDQRWETIEEPVHISNPDLAGRTVVLDCITLWLTNIFYDNKQEHNAALDVVKNEWVAICTKNINLIVISNELGMGVHGNTHETRKFVELQGWVNQYIASTADEAWMMVSGIPLKLKG